MNEYKKCKSVQNKIKKLEFIFDKYDIKTNKKKITYK